MNNLIFYKDNFINKEIAFILNIPYIYINDVKEYEKKYSDKVVFLFTEEDKSKFKEKGYKKNKNYIDLIDICDYLDQFNRKLDIYGRKEFYKNLEIINKIPLERLSLSEMFIKVLLSEPKDIDCDSIDKKANLDNYGNIWGCCAHWIAKPMGNIMLDKDYYNNYYARMIKLSSLNKTFCFCNLNNCKYYNSPTLDNFDVNKVELKATDIPEELTISTDRRCNLRCNSCRKEYYKPNLLEKKISEKVTDALIKSNLLNETKIVLAGQGEVFFSPDYLRMLDDEKKGTEIVILTNGTLLNERNWKRIEKKYKSIIISISIDAATKETYKKLRHGNFDTLVKNLEMLGKYRKENKIKRLQLNYVIQKDNLDEVLDFIKLGKRINADEIQFLKMNDWKTMKPEEYKEKSLIIDDYLDYDLYKLLERPEFKDEMVDISNFKTYMKKSKEHYKK